MTLWSMMSCSFTCTGSCTADISMPCTRWAFLCLQTKVYTGLGAAHPVAVCIVCIFIINKRLYSGAFDNGYSSNEESDDDEPHDICP